MIENMINNAYDYYRLIQLEREKINKSNNKQ